MPRVLQSILWVIVAPLLAVLTLLFVLTLLTHPPAYARPQAPFLGEIHSPHLAPDAVGAPLPRVRCAKPYTATIYAQGLSSPDGLAFNPSGVLHVAEEAAGRVSQIGPTGTFTPVVTGLAHPEGIAFDDAGNLYVVEDVQAGRLVKAPPGGATATLATGLEAPEGLVWSSDDLLYVTESNLQFATLVADLRTRVAAVSSSGQVTRVITRTPMLQGDADKKPGRDHHKDAFTMWLAGGGVQGGVTVGKTDDLGYHAVEDPHDVHDLHATILHLMGIDHERLTFKFQGRRYRLTDVAGRVVEPLLG